MSRYLQALGISALCCALASGCSSGGDDDDDMPAGSGGVPSAMATGGAPGSGGMVAVAGSGGAMPVAGSGGMGSGGAPVAGSGGMGPGGSGGAGGTGSGGAGPVAMPCTGKPGMLRGKTTHMIEAGGLSRSFILYAPSTLDPNKPAPLVVVPHGYTMSAEEMFGITGHDKLADREGLVIAYPDGQDTNPWNVGSGVCGLGSLVGATGDDQAFMNALLDFVAADQCLDEPHVFITGFSMGGYFSNETVCVNPRFAAGGPHSGGTHDLSACTGGNKPMIIFHFDTDSLIEYACGTGARDNWVAKNGCTLDAPDVTEVMGGKCEYYKGCPDAQVALCTFMAPAGGTASYPGHAWSGGSNATSMFAIPETESAAELGWAFFKKYAW